MTIDDSATAAPPHPLPHAATLQALLLVGALAVYGAANAVVPVAHDLRTAVGAPSGDAAVFLAPFAAGFAIGAVGWFALARHRPPGLVLPVAMALVAAGGVVVSLAPSITWAAAGRVLAGVGAAGYPAAAQALLTTLGPARRRGRRIGGFIVAVVAGSFAGQLAAGALADGLTTRLAVLAVTAGAPALVAIALWAALHPWRTNTQQTYAAPAPAKPILARQAPVLVVACLTFGGYWLAMSRLPEVLREERFDLGASAIAAVLSLGATGIAAAWIAGILADRVGQRVPASVLAVSGCIGLGLTLPSGVPLWCFALGIGIFLGSYWGLVPLMSAEAARRSDHTDRQPALMAMYAAMWIGATVGPLTGTDIAGWGTLGAAIIAAWAIAALVCITRFTHTTTAGPVALAAPVAGGGS